jgi:hypothetical protein
LAANTPLEPSYLAVACSCAIVAGGLNPTLYTRASTRVRSFLQSNDGQIDAIKNRNAPEVDILAVRDATLNTTAPIGRCSQPGLTIDSDPLLEHVVVLATWDLGPSETGTNLEAFGGRDGQHGVSE